MASNIEQSICELVHSLLEKLEPGDAIYESEVFRDILSHLEVFITLELRKKYREWKYESIDGIYISHASVEGINQISISGMCILVSDQSLIPIQVQFMIADSNNELDLCSKM